MRYRFCPTCGAGLTERVLGDEGLVPYCAACRAPYFDVGRPCVLVLAVNDSGQVALLRQPEVAREHWVLVAGYHKAGESAEETVVREVREETGLSVSETRYIQSYYREGKDLLLLGFVAHVTGEISQASREVDEARWFPLDEVAKQLRPGSTGMRLFVAAGDLRRGPGN